jgi:hypothetical protein
MIPRVDYLDLESRTVHPGIDKLADARQAGKVVATVAAGTALAACRGQQTFAFIQT